MLKLYNSLSNQIEDFIPQIENEVKMYVCGPTVYDKAHLGHGRCYITWDVLYRYLKFLGYKTTYCRNVTDVDDKILKKADEAGVEPNEITKEFYNSFVKSMNSINCLKPDIEPFATKTIGEMIAMNKKLIDKGYAYESDGDVYFSVDKYADYGKLSNQPIEDLKSGARVEMGDKKKAPLDFALWKKDEKFGYKSPWGVGRPGWHIECSAMSKKYLGDTIDIHAGGADLIFPHHENEIAQSECANDAQFVKYFLHNGFVTINKEKMSKSLNNFLTIDDLIKTYDSNVIRFFILTNHYRMPVEFNDEALSSAKAGVTRLLKVVQNIETIEKYDEAIINEFKEAMNNDLNTSVALSILFSTADKIKKAQGDEKIVLASTFKLLANTLGFDFSIIKKEVSEEELRQIVSPLYEIFSVDSSKNANELLDEIIQKRAQARADKDFATSDKIRDEFLKLNIVLKDSNDGTTWELK